MFYRVRRTRSQQIRDRRSINIFLAELQKKKNEIIGDNWPSELAISSSAIDNFKLSTFFLYV